jgi:hypothetical protein
MNTWCWLLGHDLDEECSCRRCFDDAHDWVACRCRRCGLKKPEKEESHAWNQCKCTRCGRVRGNGHGASKECRCPTCGLTSHDYEEGVCQNCHSTYGSVQVAVAQLGYVWWMARQSQEQCCVRGDIGAWKVVSREDELAKARGEIKAAGADGIRALEQALLDSSPVWKTRIVCRVRDWLDRTPDGDVQLAVSDEGSDPLKDGDHYLLRAVDVRCRRERVIEFAENGAAKVVGTSPVGGVKASRETSGIVHVVCSGVAAGFQVDVNVTMPPSAAVMTLFFDSNRMKENAQRLLERMQLGGRG